MEKEKVTLFTWIKKHKKALIRAGVSIGVLILAVIGMKNRKEIELLWKSLKQSISQKPIKRTSYFEPGKVVAEATDTLNDFADNIIPMTKAPHKVREHIRNLPEGHNASAEKIALAAQKGLDLLPRQTIVVEYETGSIIA